MVKNSVHSMTGFATQRGAGAGHGWVWDIRGVNGKGLDLRLRLPDWIEGLESAVRSAVTAAVGRGNVALSLKLDHAAGAGGPRVNPVALTQALIALKAVEEAAIGADLSLTPASMAEVLALRGVMDSGGEIADTGPVLAVLVDDLPGLLADFNAMRRTEGQALAGVIGAQIDAIDGLSRAAALAAEARRPAMAEALDAALARLRDAAPEADPDRIAQELALLAVKADVTEELDRLGAHVAAARALLAEGGAMGRKFDFLMQEFMREANTLCSKSGNAALTRIGLDLKTVIDQLREQVQNVE